MSSIAARISAHRQLAFFPHTSVSGEAWELVLQSRTTSAGAADGTTLVDTNGDSGAGDTYNGRYWVRDLSSANRDMMKRIIDDDGAGTLTFENNGFPNQVPQFGNYQIWKSPEPVVVVTTSGDETNMEDTARTEPDDFWNNFYAVPITGARRGKIAKITDFISSGGEFELDAGLGGALAPGDVVLLRKFIEVADVNNGVTQAYEGTPQDRLDGNKGDGRVTSKSGSFSFSSEAHGCEGVANSGSAAPRPVLGHLLQACGYEEIIGTSSTTGAGSTTSAIAVATGSWENHPIDSVVMLNFGGAMAWVTSTEDGGAGVDTVNVTPPLPVAPDSGVTLNAGVSYRRNRGGADGDYLGIGIEYEMDGVRYTMTGCRGNVTLQDGERVMLQFELQVDHWVREIERAPYYAGDAYITAEPIRGTDRSCYIDETKSDMGGITASLNNEVAPKTVQGSSGINGRAGFAHVSAAPGGTFRELLEADGDLDSDQRFLRRTSFAWNLIYGGAAQKLVGVRIPTARLMQDPTPEDANGMMDAPNVVEAQDPGTTTDGDSTQYRKGDFLLSFG